MARMASCAVASMTGEGLPGIIAGHVASICHETLPAPLRRQAARPSAQPAQKVPPLRYVWPYALLSAWIEGDRADLH